MGRPESNEAYISAKRVAEVAGVSPQRLWYWEKTDAVRPSISRRLSERNIVRLYSLDRAAEVVVLAHLVDRPEISLQQVRKVLTRLREDGAYSSPLSELRFAVDGSEVIFQHPDGTWEGSRQPDQIVEIHLRVDLDRIRATVDKARRRADDEVGVSESRRATYGSERVFAGTRVPIKAVEQFVSAGASNDRILEAYPELRPRDIEAVREKTLVERPA